MVMKHLGDSGVDDGVWTSIRCRFPAAGNSGEAIALGVSIEVTFAEIR